MNPGGVADWFFISRARRPQSRQSSKLFFSRRNWDSPNPLPAGEYGRPPLVPGGGAHSLWLERGWKSPNSDEGKCTVTLCIYMYFMWKTYFVYPGRSAPCPPCRLTSPPRTDIHTPRQCAEGRCAPPASTCSRHNLTQTYRIRTHSIETTILIKIKNNKIVF